MFNYVIFVNFFMADEKQSNTGVSKASPESKPAGEAKQRPLSGRPLIVQFGIPIPGVGAVISGVSVDNYPANGSQAEIREGSFISVVGRSLQVFDDEYWQLERQGKKPVVLKVVSGGGRDSESGNKLEGRWVTLQVPKAEFSGLNPNESLGLSFFSSRYGGKRRTLPMVFVFKFGAATTQPSPVNNVDAGTKPVLGSVPDSLTQTAGTALSAAGLGGEVIGGVAQAAKQGVQSAVKRPESASTGRVVSSKSFASASAGGANVDLGGSDDVSQADVSTLTIKQSAEVIGEHLYKNPSLIVNAGARQKILGAMQSGNFADLSVQEKQVLKSSLQSMASQQGSARAEVREAAQAILDAQIAAEAEVSGEAQSQGQVSASVAGQTQDETEVAKQARVDAQEAKIQASRRVERMDLRQSLETLGEYLEKNGLVDDQRGSRERILKALAGGNIGSLSESDRQILRASIDKVPREGRSPRLDEAQNNVSEALKPASDAQRKKAGVSDEAAAEAKISAKEKIQGRSEPPLAQGAKQEFDAKIAQMNAAGRKLDAVVLSGRSGEPDEIKLTREKDIGVTQQERVRESGGSTPDVPVEGGTAEKQEPADLPGKGEFPQPPGKDAVASEQKPPLPTGIGELNKPETEPDSKKEEKPEEKAGQSPESQEEDLQKRAEAEQQQARIENQERLKAIKEQQAQIAARDAAQKEANAALNAALMKGVMWIWLAAAETLGLSIVLGALAGDLIWVFKGWILSKFDAGRNFLHRFNGGKDSKDFKIELSGKVKLHIIAMNLAVLAVTILLAVIFFAAIRFGCQTYLLRGDYCEAIKNMDFSSITSYLSVAEAPAAPTGATCSPVPAGVASPSALIGTCFGQNATKASMVAGAESGGDPGKASRVDICTLDGSVVSWGLFQINLSAHKVAGLNCPAAFSKMYTGSNKDCRVVDQALYQQCVRAATDPATQIQTACQISGNGTNWNAWAFTKNKCGL